MKRIEAKYPNVKYIYRENVAPDQSNPFAEDMIAKQNANIVIGSAEFMVKNHASLEKKVYVVPKDIDDEIARLKLESMAVDCDTLTEEQAKYLASWDEGT